MVFEMYPRFLMDGSKQWRWRLRAKNGRIMADSGESYWHRVDCRRAMRKIRFGAILAKVEQVMK